MAPLPNSTQAILDLRKLEDYCLDPKHPRGRHKARVFRELLGIGRNDARWLQCELLLALTDGDAFELSADKFGRRWRLDVTVARQEQRAVIRTLWLIRTGEEFPRFVTCWV
ncbi:MAG TPA: hypothetical protein VIJ62_09550, partial [Rhizomicrobium sp.]